jgi:hypothetical protein
MGFDYRKIGLKHIGYYIIKSFWAHIFILFVLF